MTTHIKNRIEKILFNGGIVSLELIKIINNENKKSIRHI